MPTELIAQATARIEHILERFHETHRRELPLIEQHARDCEAAGGPAGLAAAMQALGRALEDHMFKEEMRLFPMMEQGGNTLIRHLIADMQAEHVAHRGTMDEVRAMLTQAQAPAAAQPALDALRAAVAKLFDDLEQHIAAEDDDLFRLFATP